MVFYYYFLFDIQDVLITLGTMIAFSFSVLSMVYSLATRGRIPSQVFFETCVSLITFVSWGRYLENLAKARTTSSLSKLLTLAPSHATIILKGNDGKDAEKRIPTTLIQENDFIKVKPGEKIPADGEIESGDTTVDEAIITGEAFPVPKTVKGTVIGGSINLTVNL
jgi:Cu+-exporting ATPase